MYNHIAAELVHVWTHPSAIPMILTKPLIIIIILRHDIKL